MPKSINKKYLFLILVLLFTIPSFYKLLRPGYYSMQDDLQAFRLYEMDKCFQDYQIPCRWVPDAGYGYGYPQFNFYAPGVYYMGELIHLLGLQFIDVVKILFVIGFIVGAYFMFILIRELFGNFSGFVTSLLYTYAPYKAQEVYVRGALSEFWGSAILPIIFWSSYKLIKYGGRKYFAFFAASTFFLLTTHNLLPLITFPLLVIWILFFLWREKKWDRLRGTVLGFLLGIMLSSFFIIPLVLERKYIHSETLLSGYFDYRRHFISLKQIFFSNTFGYGSSDLGANDDLALNSGSVLLLGGMFGLIFSIYNFKKNKKTALFVIFLLIIELIVLFMMHLKSSFIWKALPILQWLQFPWRLLAISIFILSLASGAAIKLSGKFKYIVGGLMIMLVFLLHGSFFQPKDWFDETDQSKFSGDNWEKQLTISIGDYLPIYAEFPPNQKALDEPEVLSGSFELIDLSKGSNHQKGTFIVNEISMIRLQMYDFPGMNVTVNGTNVKHNNDKCQNQDYCFGLISFTLQPGENEFYAVLKNTKVRTISNFLTVLGLFSILYIFFVKENEKINKIIG